MQNFNVDFRNHGVCKQKGSNEFSHCPQVKAAVSSLIYRCTESANTVQGVLEDLIERVVLKLEILHFCDEAFNICILRSTVAAVLLYLCLILLTIQFYSFSVLGYSSNRSSLFQKSFEFLRMLDFFQRQVRFSSFIKY